MDRLIEMFFFHWTSIFNGVFKQLFLSCQNHFILLQSKFSIKFKNLDFQKLQSTLLNFRKIMQKLLSKYFKYQFLKLTQKFFIIARFIKNFQRLFFTSL